MKRYHFIVAALLVLPVFFSCGGKDDPIDPDNPSTPSTPSTPSEPSVPDTPVPAEPQIEFRRTFRFGNNIISANGSKDFIAVFEDGLITKAGDERQILTGKFSFDNSGKAYDFSGFGKLELLEGDKIAFTPSDGIRSVYDAEVSEIVADEGSNANRMNGSWTINEAIVEFRGVTKTFKGLDLNEVERFVKDLGYEFAIDVEDNMVVTKVILTDALAAVEFKNGQSFAAEHNLRQGDSFSLSEFSNDLEGTAKVQFVDELCVITINSSFEQEPAKLRFTLKPVK